jgi:hypothetical protein
MSAARQCEASKAESILASRCALAGWQLVRLADGSFLVSRWGQARPLPDLWSVHRFLEQVGAR